MKHASTKAAADTTARAADGMNEPRVADEYSIEGDGPGEGEGGDDAHDWEDDGAVGACAGGNEDAGAGGSAARTLIMSLSPSLQWARSALAK